MFWNRGDASLVALIAPLLLAAALQAQAAGTIVDLGQPGTSPAIPAVVNETNRPLYITNTSPGGAGTAASGAVDSLRVGAYSTMHLGYDNTAVAQGDIMLDVGGATGAGMLVEGAVRLGKAATTGAPGLPNAATAYRLSLTVAGNLTVDGGRLDAVATTADMGVDVAVGGGTIISRKGLMTLAGANYAGSAALRTNYLALSGGKLILNPYAQVYTTNTMPQAGTGQAPFHSVAIGEGGILVLNGGIPVPGEFAGVSVAAGGDGVWVGRGGMLRTGRNGGLIAGQTGQRLAVDRGGVLDASRGEMQITGISAIDLGGNYLAGYTGYAGTINRLVAADAGITILGGSNLGMDRALQKHLNSLPTLGIDNAAILRGGSIAFAPGTSAVVQSGLGEYTLAVGVDPGDLMTSLWVNGVRNRVHGDGSAGDMATFRNNLEAMPWQGRVNSAMADTIYNTSVADLPGITLYGRAGRFNREVFDAFIAGYGQHIGESGGIADDGIFELYNGAAQYGPTRVASNTAGELVETVGRRIAQVRTEFAAGTGVAESYTALANLGTDEICGYDNRFWVGGFARREEADLDYGIAGYKYKPNGFVLGYDRAIGRFAVGGAVAYADGDYEDRAAVGNDSKIASYSASVYGSYNACSGFNASGFATYSYLDNDLSDIRGNLHRTADYHGDAWSAGAKVGYDLSPADRLLLSPSVGLTYIEAKNRAHDEYLDGVNVIRVGDVKQRSTLLPVDIGIGYDLFRGDTSLLRLTTNFGYAYDFNSDGVTGDFLYQDLAGASPIPVAGRDPGRHRFNFGAGLLYSGSRLDVGARYEYYRRSHEDAQQFKGSLGVKF